MTWPIPTLPTNWANSSPQVDAHPLAHNQLADAINELYARLPRGYVGHALPAAPTTSILSTVVDIVGMSVTFTADATRRYKVSMTTYRIDQAAATGNVSVRLTNAAGSLLSGASIESITLAAGQFSYVHCEAVLLGTASGSYTVKGRISTDAGSCTLQAGGLIIVEDIGGV